MFKHNDSIRHHRGGASVLDVVVTFVVVVCAVCVLLPVLARAGEGGVLGCLDNARGFGAALLSYGAEHDSVMPADTRDLDPGDDVDELRFVASTEDQYANSWLGHVESYLPSDPEALDCPVIDDHRKGEWWPTDYVINRWGVGMSTESATEPARALLVGEPNMQRGSVDMLADIIAWADWGPRPDLEQKMVGSLSFVFADGHGERITIAEGDNPHLAVYSQIMQARPGDAENYRENWLWWYQDQTRPAGR